MSAVELRNVTKRFGAVVATDRVSLTVPPGTITALLGPSGCGKTTTLRLVAGFTAPDEGEIEVGDTVVTGGGVFVPPERRRVGVVFQQLALFPHLDVAGNVAYGLRSWARPARRARVAELLELVGLAGMEHRLPNELSGGQAQRVAVARALAPKPAVVLLDEPFSSLDVSRRDEVRAEVRRILRAEGATGLLVTHDQDEALVLGDQVAVMLGGRIAQTGPPDEVYGRPGTPAVAEFLGEANLFAGDVRDGLLHTVIGPVEVDAPDGPATGLVRPEDLDLQLAPGSRCRVVDVEYFGHDQRITVDLGDGTRVKVRLHARLRFEAGSEVRLRPTAKTFVTFGSS